MSDDKLQISINKIDTNHDCFADCEKAIETLSTAIQDEDVSYNEQTIQDNISTDYEIALLYKKNPRSPKWKTFLSSLATRGQDVLKKK